MKEVPSYSSVAQNTKGHAGNSLDTGILSAYVNYK